MGESTVGDFNPVQNQMLKAAHTLQMGKTSIGDRISAPMINAQRLQLGEGFEMDQSSVGRGVRESQMFEVRQGLQAGKSGVRD